MAKALSMGNKDVQFRQVSNLISHLISNKSTGEEPCLENKMQVFMPNIFQMSKLYSLNSMATSSFRDKSQMPTIKRTAYYSNCFF